MDQVVFERSVRQGSVLRFDAQRYKIGNSSVQYEVKVYVDSLDTGDEESVFSTHITFVCLDHSGNKTPLPEPHSNERP